MIRSPGLGLWALEAWSAGRNIIANDLSPYAALLTRAKLFPYRSLKDAAVEVSPAVGLTEAFHAQTRAWSVGLASERHTPDEIRVACRQSSARRLRRERFRAYPP
jgi:hypothetical protein